MTPNSDAKPTLIVGGVPEHYNLPWHMAMESAEAADFPVNLEWYDTLGGTGETAAMLESGQLDLAVALTEGMVAAIAHDNPSVILRTYVTTPLQWGVHVPASSELYDMADLAGQRFAISRLGSGSHLMGHVLAHDVGFAPTDESFVKVGNLDGAREALAQGAAEIFLWDRSTTSPYVENGEFRRIGLQPTPWPAFVVVARTEIAAAHSDAIASVLDAVASKAVELVNNGDRVEIVAARYGIERDEVTEWFSETSWDCAQPVGLEMIASTQDRLVELGLITDPKEPAHFVL